MATVDPTGGFRWANGNIGAYRYADDIVLSYGQTYHFAGWAILPTFDGTRFTNDRTGHGMFVSIENTYPF